MQYFKMAKLKFANLLYGKDLSHHWHQSRVASGPFLGQTKICFPMTSHVPTGTQTAVLLF